jgi:hypothetical protein
MSTIGNRFNVVHKEQWHDAGFTNENSLARALDSKPDQLTPVLTHLLGSYKSSYPLTYLTEGQIGGAKPKKAMNNVEFEYAVINKLRRSDEVVSSSYSASDKPGLGFSYFYVTMRTAWLKRQHNIESSNGTRARVIDYVPEGNYYKYTFQLHGTDTTTFCPFADVSAGARWTMVGGANVAQSLSMGNESNVVTPGYLKNQLSTLRKSYRLAGNIANKRMSINFNMEGKTSNMWMDWEEFQHMISWYEHCEEQLWYSEYNRTANGYIHQRDPETNLPIYMSAGLLQQIPNETTYSFLTAKKVKQVVRNALFGALDAAQMDIMVFVGTGSREEFHNAMRDELASWGFVLTNSDKFVQGSGSSLILGGYFDTYVHVDGHRISLKHLPMLDTGGRAIASRQHPITGLPITSYDMYFVDMSTYDGERNVTLQYEEGRMMRRGVVNGMATPPDGSGDSAVRQIATEQDVHSVHFLATKAVTIRRNTHCFKLSCDLS